MVLQSLGGLHSTCLLVLLDTIRLHSTSLVVLLATNALHSIACCQRPLGCWGL